MVIYIDVLVFTNTIIDYLLLLTTSFIVKKSYSVFRLLAASVVGGLSSVYILLDSGLIIVDVAYKLFCCAILIAISYGFRRGFFLAAAVLLGLSFALNGAVVFIENLISPNIALNGNLISYFNISPLLLIVITGALYLFFKIIQRILQRGTHNIKAELIVKICSKEYVFSALVDTGLSVQDPFGDAQIFIVDNHEFSKIIMNIPTNEFKRRKRMIPVKTIGNSELLQAVRCDSGKICIDGNTFLFIKPVICSSNEDIANGFSAIISKNTLDVIPETRGETV